MVMLKFWEGPVHVPITGVAIKFAVALTPLKLIAAKEAIFPEPAAARPIVGSELVQLIVVNVAGVGLKLIAVVDVVAHNV
jgi:hypothetical protein